MNDDSMINFRLFSHEARLTALESSMFSEVDKGDVIDFDDLPPRVDQEQRVYGGEGGSGDVAREPFTLRVAKRSKTIGEGEAAEVVVATYIDIYNPQGSTGSSVQVSLGNTLERVDGSAWSQLYEIPEGTTDGIVVYCDSQFMFQTEAVYKHARKLTFVLFLEIGGSLYEADGTSSPPAYTEAVVGATTSHEVGRVLFMESSQEHYVRSQRNSGVLSVSYPYKGAEKLFVEVDDESGGTTITSDLSDITWAKDTVIYLCKTNGEEGMFGDVHWHSLDDANPVQVDSNLEQVFTSKLPVEMHANDHYDGFIPFP